MRRKETWSLFMLQVMLGKTLDQRRRKAQSCRALTSEYKWPVCFPSEEEIKLQEWIYGDYCAFCNIFQQVVRCALHGLVETANISCSGHMYCTYLDVLCRLLYILLY